MMTDFDTDSYSEAELEAEFDRLFPQGFAGPDVVQELAPGGWENSPLLAVFHPSLAQTYEETLRMHRNICKLRTANDQRRLPPEPTLEEVARDFREHPIQAEREVRELVGQCLWDVFSEGNEVVALDGRVLDLGSFRASGGFLAEIVNRQSCAEHYDYLNKRSTIGTWPRCADHLTRGIARDRGSPERPAPGHGAGIRRGLRLLSAWMAALAVILVGEVLGPWSLVLGSENKG